MCDPALLNSKFLLPSFPSQSMVASTLSVPVAKIHGGHIWPLSFSHACLLIYQKILFFSSSLKIHPDSDLFSTLIALVLSYNHLLLYYCNSLPAMLFICTHLYELSRFSCLFATPWTVACQAPLSMGFSRQENWSGSPCPPPGDLPDPGMEPGSPVLQADSLLLSHQICTHPPLTVYSQPSSQTEPFKIQVR